MRKLRRCTRCGNTGVEYPSLKKFDCVHCKNFKLDLQVQAEVPKGKIKVNPTPATPLFTKTATDKQFELF